MELPLQISILFWKFFPFSYHIDTLFEKRPFSGTSFYGSIIKTNFLYFTVIALPGQDIIVFLSSYFLHSGIHFFQIVLTLSR